MSRWVNLFVVAAIFLAGAGCAQTQSISKRPAQPIYSLATKQADKPNSFLKATSNAALGTWKGTIWVFKELLRPLDSMRKGLIHLFGVPGEQVVLERSIPPNPANLSQR